MTSLSDSVAALQADRDALHAQCEAQRGQIERQRGAIEEGRADREQLHKIIGRLQSVCHSYEAYFRSLHHGLNDLKAQTANEEETRRAPPTGLRSTALKGLEAAPVVSLADRISRIGKNGHAA